MRPRLLLVEDDRQLNAMLVQLLSDEGYEVEPALDGQRGLHLALTRDYDLMVLDRGLPALDGLDLLGRLRQRGVVTPVLVLSALGLVTDRIEGLDAGAEDYLGKPFDVDELLARLRALTRRHREEAQGLAVPGGWLDLETRVVQLDDGARVDLSERERDLLATLARQPRQVLSRATLLSTVFAQADEPGVVDTYVHYLRRKLGRGAVRTVRGIGYQLGQR
ncbi:two-component system response regulator QseB [Friedmanniella endophytica]|uniref:Two-component system response regulator QseB n=1 Tax=Microlunatus kandeliicorticis TaxID=1759536 RepID=A0A7W3IVC2_9ACTN|nr:response regulator transcription factor [Microlunatus kandeliicorticis]MBA8795932.1 two-component system response regulator QseB [Microlunatus kandeliicorticis]